MGEEFIIASPAQRSKSKELDTGTNCLTMFECILDLRFVFPGQGGGVLGQKLENVVPYEIGIVLICDAENIGNTRRVEMYGEVRVFDDDILPHVSKIAAWTKEDRYATIPLSMQCRKPPSAS